MSKYNYFLFNSQQYIFYWYLNFKKRVILPKSAEDLENVSSALSFKFFLKHLLLTKSQI